MTITIDVLGRSPSPTLVPGRDTAGIVYDLEMTDDGLVTEIERGRPEMCPYGLTGSEIAQAAGHWTPVMTDEAVIERHDELVDRKFSTGLNGLEEVELSHFAERIDEILESADQAVLARLIEMTPTPKF